VSRDALLDPEIIVVGGMGSLRDLCSIFLGFWDDFGSVRGREGATHFMGGPERKGGTAERCGGVVAIGIGNFGAESQLPALMIKSENVPVRP
jgi:hypothetical protein